MDSMNFISSMCSLAVLTCESDNGKVRECEGELVREAADQPCWVVFQIAPGSIGSCFLLNLDGQSCAAVYSILTLAGLENSGRV